MTERDLVRAARRDRRVADRRHDARRQDRRRSHRVRRRSGRRAHRRRRRISATSSGGGYVDVLLAGQRARGARRRAGALRHVARRRPGDRRAGRRRPPPPHARDQRDLSRRRHPRRGRVRACSRRASCSSASATSVDYVLAGSIRDDGPLPDTIMNLVEAQDRYAEALQDVNCVLVLSTMLHGIGVGNMLPAWVKAGLRRHQPGGRHQARRTAVVADDRARHRHRTLRAPAGRASCPECRWKGSRSAFSRSRPGGCAGGDGFCYLCKVLVGPRTPYLEPDFKTRTARSLCSGAPPRKAGFCPGSPGGGGTYRTRPRGPSTHKLYRVSQFQVPGRFGGSLGLEQPTDSRALDAIERVGRRRLFCFARASYGRA